jgi:S-formylglutathione hydrolase
MERSGPRIGAAALALAVLLSACGSSSVSTGPAASPNAGSPTAGSGAASPTAASPSAAASAGPTSCGSPSPDGAIYSMATCQIDAPSLAGNLLGDRAAVTAYILTPSDYETSSARYPVVYVLAGFTDPGSGIAFYLGDSPAPAAGAISPILVVVSGVNGLGGGFYTNSSVTGNWEDAITHDVVGYVDAHYRTLASAASRGIAGHSMGGYGALAIAMNHPELFSAVFAESPGLFDKDGAAARLADPAVIASVLELQTQVAGLKPQEAAGKIKIAALAGEGLQFEVAYGAAFAPDPASPSLMKFPFSTKNGQTVRDDAVWASWEAGFGNLPARVEANKAKLAQLKGIAIDWGTTDQYAWIPKGCEYLVGLLQAAGLNPTGSSFEGGHEDQLAARLTGKMMPFMEGLLATK